MNRVTTAIARRLSIHKCLRMRSRLKNSGFTIISQNCVGGCVYHDLGLRFLSPTVNLWFPFPDFLRLCEDLGGYLAEPLGFLPDQGIGYPVAMLGDVRVFFMHYASEGEARGAWERRAARVNLSNAFVMACDRDGFSGGADAQAFEALPCKDKVLFTSRPYPGCPSALALPDFAGKPEVGILTDYRDILGRRHYERGFDVVSFLNREGRR